MTTEQNTREQNVEELRNIFTILFGEDVPADATEELIQALAGEEIDG